MTLVTKITRDNLLSKLRGGNENNVIMRGSHFNELVDAVNGLDTRVADVEDGVYSIDLFSVGAGLVGAPSLAVGSSDKGLYEVSGVQLGVSVSGALATLFDTDGIKTDSVRARVEFGTAGTGVTAVSYGDGRNFTTVLTLESVVVGTLPGAAVDLAMGAEIYSLPAGAQYTEFVYMSVGLTGAGTANTPDVGIGSVIGVGAVNVLGGTAEFEDYVDGQTAADISGTPTEIGAPPANSIRVNYSGDSKDLFLNVAGAWAVDNIDSLVADGTVVIKWTVLA
jgi:hypothetical protein